MVHEMKQRAIRWMDIAALVAVAFTALGWIAEARGWLDPHPFRNVRDVSVTAQVDGRYLVQAAYEKTGAPCNLVLPIMVFGWTFGERVPVDYEPVRRTNEGAQRYEGQQQMTLLIDAQARALDRIEVWTRHDCEGKRVDTKMIDLEI